MTRFVAHTPYITIGPDAYLRLQPEESAKRLRPYELPEDERPVIPPFDPVFPPDMEAGDVILLKDKPCPVLWCEGSRAIVEIEGRPWLISHMTPQELATYRHGFERGAGIQEYIVREAVEVEVVGRA